MGLSSIRLILTRKCNLSCQYCFEEGLHGEEEDNLSGKELGLIFEYVKERGIRKIQVTGGEPFESDLMGELLKLASNYSKHYVDFVVTTNGTNHSAIKENLHYFENNRKMRINVSVPMFDQQKYCMLTGCNSGDAYNSLIKTLDMLADTNIRVKINTVLLKDFSFSHIDQVIQEVEKRKFELRFIELITSINDKSKENWLNSQYVSPSGFNEKMMALGYGKAKEKDKRIARFKDQEGQRPDVSFIRCCPQICAHCAREVSCLRITSSGRIKSCLVEQPTKKTIWKKGRKAAFSLLDEAARTIDEQTRSRHSISTDFNVSSHTEVMLFVSFDVVNSSRLKLFSYKVWQQILSRILEHTKSELVKDTSLLLWRIIGDELVFFMQLHSVAEAQEAIPKIYKKLQNINRGIYQGTLFDEIEYSNSLSQIALRSSSWIAPVFFPSHFNAIGEADYNFAYLFSMNSQEKSNLYNLEFQGSDFDTGFRLSKQSGRGELTISFELACLLSEKVAFDEFIAVTSLTVLDGVWNGKLYPIIKYADKEICYFKEPDYEDTYNADLTKKNEPERLSGDGLRKLLNAIQKTMMLEEKMRRIRWILSNADFAEYVNLMQPTKPIDLHLVAVCVKDGDPGRGPKEILMFQRSAGPSQAMGQWDFGYCKLVVGKEQVAFQDIIQEQYLQQFGVTIVVDGPIQTYQVSKDYENVLGIRFEAKIVNDSSLKAAKEEGFLNDKYVNYKYFTYDEIKEKGNDAFVDWVQVREISSKLLGVSEV